MAQIINLYSRVQPELTHEVLLEKCVLCHKDVEIPQGVPVDLRQFFVDGGGQLCENCYLKIYGDA